MDGRAPDNKAKTLSADKIADDIKSKIRELGAVSVREIIDQFKITDENYLEIEKVIAKDQEFVVGPQFAQGRVFRGIRYTKKAADTATPSASSPPPAPQLAAPPPAPTSNAAEKPSGLSLDDGKKPDRAPLFTSPPPPAATHTNLPPALAKPIENLVMSAAPPPAPANPPVVPAAPVAALSSPEPATKSGPIVGETVKPAFALDLKAKTAPDPIAQILPTPPGAPRAPSNEPAIVTRPITLAPQAPPPTLTQTYQPITIPTPPAAPALTPPSAPTLAPPTPPPAPTLTASTPPPPPKVETPETHLSMTVTSYDPAWAQMRPEAHLPQMPETHRVASERLADLLTMAELESLLGITAHSPWKMPQVSDQHRKMLAAMLVHRYDRDLLTIKPLRDLLAKKLNIDISDRLESSVANAIWFLRKAQLPFELLPPSWADRKASHGALRSGPRRMKLEEYQIEIIDLVANVLNVPPNAPNRRVLLSLPRGAGKSTSVIVGIQKWFATSVRPMQILWVARNENQADVAVSAFEQAWLRNHIAPEVQYARVWGSHNQDFFEKKETIESMHRHHRSILITHADDLTKRAQEMGNETFISLMGHVDAIVFDQCDVRWLETSVSFLKNVFGQHPGVRYIGLCSSNDLKSTSWSEVFGAPYSIKALGEGEPLKTLKERQVLAEFNLSYLDIPQDRILPGDLRRQMSQMDDSSISVLESTLCTFVDSAQRRTEIVRYLTTQKGRKQILYFGIHREDAQATAVELTNHGMTAVYISGEMSDLTKIQMLRAGFQVICADETLPKDFFEKPPEFVLISRPMLSLAGLVDILASCGSGAKWRGHAHVDIKLVEDVFAGERMPLRHLHLEASPDAPSERREGGHAIDEVIEVLLDSATGYIDRRSVGGKLWVLYSSDAQPVVEQLIKRGFKFVHVPEGHAATKGKAAWYLDAD